MFGNLLGRNKKETSKEDKVNAEVVHRISQMNLTDMRAYVRNNMKGIESCSDGLIAVMDRLITKNEDTMKRYIEIDDMDTKIKKGFELVLSVASHKKVTVTTVEQIQAFIVLYEDLILKFDKEYKQIYETRLNNGLEQALKTVDIMADVNRKEDVLSK